MSEEMINQDKIKEQRLVELWNSLSLLNEQKWGELYTLCKFFLITHTSNKIRTYFNSLQEEPDALLNQYFLQKILQPSAAKKTRCQIKHIGAVRSFFYRFLVDQERMQNHQPNASVSIGNAGENESDDNLMMIDPAAKSENNSVQILLNTTQQSLAYFVHESKKFIESLNKDEQLLLRCAFEEGLSALTLASHYGIASYAYKAKKLGLAKTKTGAKALNDSSILMRWFILLALNPPKEHLDEIQGLLKILASTSLEYNMLDESLLHPSKGEH